MPNKEEYKYSLLDEIVAVCNKKKAVYYLIGKELLYDTIGGKAESYDVDICMTLSDYKLIADILSYKEDRVVESIDTNPDMPGMYYRYVRTDTLMIIPEYIDVLKEAGLAVNIHIIRNTSEDSKKLIRYEEVMESGIKGIEKNHDRETEISFEEGKSVTGFSEKMNELLSAAALCDKKGDSIIKLPGLPEIVLPSGYFEGIANITTAKRKYTTVKKPEIILSKCYGNDFDEKLYYSDVNLLKIIVYTDISYKDLDEDFWQLFRKDNEYWSERKDVLTYLQDTRGKLQYQIRKADDILPWTDDRLKLWKRYRTKKKMVIELFDKGHYDELSLIFSDIDAAADRHLRLKYGRVPFFDRKIWDIYLEVLRVQGKADRAEELQKALENYPVEELDNEKLESYYHPR